MSQATVEVPTKQKAKMSRQKRQILSTLAALLMLFLFFTLANRNFISMMNILNILKQATPIIIIAIGQTFVLITAGIDLSIGSVIACSGVVAAIFMRDGMPVWISMVAGLLFGVLVGVINGSLIVYGKLPAFIATMGTMTTVRGLALFLTQGIPIGSLPKEFTQIGTQRTFNVPNQVYIMAILAIIFGFVLSKTKIGRYTYAMGSNYEATRLSGVNVNRTLIIVYTISGFLAAWAGMIMTANVISAAPTAGDGYELDAVASSVIGGASTLGGEGIIPGTVLGALVIATLRNGLNLSGASPFIQKMIIGIVIIAAVFIDRFKRED
ncbi:MAG TPA: ABC transporter permease [Flexilinea sp.]|jgi:ribose transport system permease protein|nr:ABC transporter permease [Flexilinea sp.]HPJ64828.1 ABC transporter permease [Flexilinea sp.]HPR70854.1 ABC transporter permease [Flexilinea sp.]HQF80121.1 ABC transporter permease [Flexilinea sp.]HQG89229.1 ABC transporter permease [Flexilinea sp.]